MSLNARLLKDIANLIMQSYMMDDIIVYGRLYTVIHVVCADAKEYYEQPYCDLLLNIPSEHTASFYVDTASFYVDKIAEAIKQL